MTDVPARSRGVIALDAGACTSCMLCARECPDWCIHIESHKEVEPGPGRPKVTHVLDRFDLDFALCMYCGICVEVCPFDALFWAPDHAYASTDLLGLTHDRERLGGWLAGAPEGPTSPAGSQVTPSETGNEQG